MGNPYGGYGPAQALRDTGNSLADIVKEFAGVKLADARLGLEEKKLTLEGERIKSGLAKDLALADFAKETELAGIRRGTAQDLEAKRHAIEAERIARTQAGTQAGLAAATMAHQKEMESIARDTFDMQKRESDIRAKEDELLAKEDTWGNWVQSSGLPNNYKTLIKEHTDPVDWNRKIAGRDWKMWIEGGMRNPKLVFDGLIMGLNEKIKDIQARLQNAKTEEEFRQIEEKEYGPALSHMLQMKTIIGEGPELTERDQIKIVELGTAIYRADPSAYPGGAQEAIDQVRVGTQKIREAYHSAKYPTGAEIKAWSKNATGKNSKDNADLNFANKMDELEKLEPQLLAAGIDFGKFKEKAKEKYKANPAAGMKFVDDAFQKAQGVNARSKEGGTAEKMKAIEDVYRKAGKKSGQQAWDMEGYAIPKEEKPAVPVPEAWPENLSDVAAEMEKIYRRK